MRWFGRRMKAVLAQSGTTWEDAYVDVLVPVDALSLEALQKIPEHATARVEASVPRNGAYHRFYWAMLGKIRQNLPPSVSLDLEALHQVVKMGAGHTQVIKLPGDTFYELPRSISFDKMDETEFRAFMDNAIKFIVTKLIPDMDEDVLTNEVYDFLAGGR